MQTKKKQPTYWDQFKRPTGPEGKTVAKLMNKNHNALSNWGLEKVKIKPDFFILDIGCGGGKTITKLAKQAPHGKIFGIDHSSDMVDYSKEVNKELIAQNRVTIVEASVEKTKFPNNFFDLATAIETYYFWPNLPDAFQEIKRILKPKAKLALINEMIKNRVYEEKNAEMIMKTHVKLLTLEEIQKILQSVGFIDIQVFTKKNSAWNMIVGSKP